MSMAARRWIVLLVAATLLTACGGNLGTSTPIDPDALSTSLVATMVDSLFQTQTALAPAPAPADSATPIPLVAMSVPTIASVTASPYYLPVLATPALSLTPSVTGTIYTPTIDPNTLAYGCNNLAFIRDVTVPAGTVMSPGEDFTKTWKVANIGTCNWMYEYAIVFLSGETMNGKLTRLGKLVTADHWAELSVQMGAPKKEGTHVGYWRMSDGAGHMFGETLAVSIVVSTTSTDTSVPDTATPSDTPVPTDTPTETPTP